MEPFPIREQSCNFCRLIASFLWHTCPLSPSPIDLPRPAIRGLRDPPVVPASLKTVQQLSFEPDRAALQKKGQSKNRSLLIGARGWKPSGPLSLQKIKTQNPSNITLNQVRTENSPSRENGRYPTEQNAVLFQQASRVMNGSRILLR